jgi:hypothetical protein
LGRETLRAQQPMTHRDSILLIAKELSSGIKPEIKAKKLKIDSTTVHPATVSEETERKIFSDKDYVYKEDELKRSKNIISQFWDWLTKDRTNKEKEKEKRDKENTDYSQKSRTWGGGGSGWMSNFIIFLCIAAIVGGIVYLFATGKFKTMFTPKPLETPFDFKEMTEDIEGLNIDKLIEQAKVKGDFRLATRWWYLKILQKFTTCNYIDWRPYKTNFEYYRELQNTKYVEAFKQASHIYENVWYWEMPVNEQMYSSYTPQLAELEKNIHA